MVAERVDDALQRVEQLREEALGAIARADSTAQLEQIRVQHTGKKSPLRQVMQAMGRLAPEERPVLGAAVNSAMQEVEQALASRTEELRRSELSRRLEEERLDVTLPGTEYLLGYRSPLLQAVDEILAIFEQMGFSVYEGPEVEWDLFNFTLLNIPPDHPARDLQDTFYLSEDIVLRTQTSPGQIRVMQAQGPPVRVAVPGFVYRNEAEDPSHLDRFFQIEGLAVDTDITMGDLKGTLTELAHRYFGQDRAVRFRPSYFPFTEPSAELDIQCAVCKGAGCRSCGGEGWLELLGSGMVHPSVLENVGYDPEEVSGFAFGLGPDRFAMMKYGITDLRLYRENDLRFLRQFS
jgi:phenylalanyl-tRNA synthetase alpha chain